MGLRSKFRFGVVDSATGSCCCPCNETACEGTHVVADGTDCIVPDGQVDWIEHIAGEYDLDNNAWMPIVDDEHSKDLDADATPETVWFDSVEATKGTAGNLAAGEWDYNATAQILFVRLSDSTSPCDKADGFVSLEYEDTIIRVEKFGPCVTYYVNSVSGGGAETGTGTETDPWTNLNTVFSDSCICAICTNECCPKVKVLVKGTIDYKIAGGGSYGRNLIIEPWGEERITIEVEESLTRLSTTGAVSCGECIWKNADVEFIGTAADSAAWGAVGCGFHNSGGSTFDNCTVIVTNTATGAGANGFQAYSFHNSGGSTFDNCTDTVTVTATTTSIVYSYGFVYAHSFNNCHSSTFNNCAGTAIGSGNVTSGYAQSLIYSFSNCYSSTFNNCTGTATGSGDGSTYHIALVKSFNNCHSSTFNNCTGTATATSNGLQYGSNYADAYSDSFNNCHSSTFNNCTGTATATNTGAGFSRAYGFHKLATSGACTFDGCSGTGNSIGSGTCNCCGFYGNANSWFCDCTQSDNCDQPTCDDISDDC